MKFLASGEQRMYLLEEPPKNKTIFLESFPKCGWVGGWFPNKVQAPQKKTNHPENSRFDPNLIKTMGWVKRFDKTFQKKTVLFLGGSPL